MAHDDAAGGGSREARPRGRPLALGPMSFTDVLDGAFTLYRAEAGTLVLLSAAFLLPVQLLSAWFNRGLFESNPASLFNSGSSGPFTTGDVSAGSIAVTAVAAVLVTPFLAGVVCRVAVAAYLGGYVGLEDAVKSTRGRWWALSVAWLLVHAAEAAAGMACGLPALAAMALFVAVAPALVVEGLGPVAAMRRSAGLVGSRLFPVLGIAAGSGFLVVAIAFALGWLPGAVGAVAGRWGWVPAAAGSVLTGVVTAPYVAIVASLVYLDARTRREGMDLAILAAELPGG